MNKAFILCDGILLHLFLYRLQFVFCSFLSSLKIVDVVVVRLVVIIRTGREVNQGFFE